MRVYGVALNSKGFPELFIFKSKKEFESKESWIAEKWLALATSFDMHVRGYYNEPYTRSIVVHSDLQITAFNLMYEAFLTYEKGKEKFKGYYPERRG